MRLSIFRFAGVSLLATALNIGCYAAEWLNPDQDDLVFNPKVNKPAPAPAPTPAPVKQHGKPDYVDSYDVPSNSLVIIEGDRGVGSGFLAKIKGKLFVVTNVHVIAGNEYNRYVTMDKQELQVGQTIYISGDRDIAIIPVAETDSYLNVHESMDVDVEIGDWVIVLGNSEGAGVVTKLTGKIQGIGPDEIEISAKFVKGNSGSPIIHAETGSVVGVVTYLKAANLKDFSVRDSSFFRIRRFGYRLDNNEVWEEITQRQLYEQQLLMNEFDERTEAMGFIIRTMLSEGFVPTTLNLHPSLDHVLDAYAKNYTYGRGDSRGNQEALAKLKSDLIGELDRDKKTVERELMHGYFKSMLEANMMGRYRLMEALKLIKTLNRR